MVSVESLPIRSEIRDRYRSMVELRRDLHHNPELGFEEKRTARIVAERLAAANISHRTEVARTGITALIEGSGSQAARTVLLRADMDALPIQEESDRDYASQNPGVMHACGHDGHTSILLHTALEMERQRRSLGVSCKLVFQPAEEGPGGALPMIEAGVLEDPKVEAAFGLHLWNHIPRGQVAITSGPFMAAADEFEILVQGRGGHGAYPHEACDALLIGAYIVTALQTLVSRNTGPTETAVVSIGTFNSGSNFNIIAETARMRGTLRTFNPEVRELLIRRLREVATQTAETFGAECEFHFFDHYPPVVNDAEMADFAAEVAAEVVGPENVRRDLVSMGGEDMAYFLQRVPGCYFFIGSSNEEAGLDYPHHSPHFDFDESVMLIGSEIFLRLLERYPERFPA